MAISGNKGEWSEIYTLFKLLGEGKVHAGDANMRKLKLYYPILNIIREENSRFEYKTDEQHHLIIIDSDGEIFAKISMDKFLQEAEKLLLEIINNKSSSFKIPTTEAFMHEVGCSKLKAPSNDKADIHIVIHDLRTGMTPLLGFSIKSQLGSPSTLLNAGKPTNITFRVSGERLTNKDIQDINNIEEHLQRINAIYEKGCALEYYDIEHNTFKNNLLFLDTCMPQFIADCLIADSLPYSSTSDIRDCVSQVALKNPFKFNGSDVYEFYAHKMKILLIDAALGMTAAKEWWGKYDANGGYLVVRKDGDIVCYHFYNRNDIEDYLFNNTKFERASRTRYQYGVLYQKGKETFIKLNLQIRFKK